jgi:glycosyltransferase involved in cell wall biosynthesis
MIWEDLSPRSGSRRFLFEATPRLQKQGHEVKIFTTKLDREICYPELLNLPIEVVTKERSSFGRFFKRTLGRDLDHYWVLARVYMEMSRRIAQWQPDVVVFNYAGEPWLPQYFYYLRKRIGVVTLHVIPGGKPSSRKWSSWKIEQRIRALPPMGRWNVHSLKNLIGYVTHSRYVYERATEVLGHNISTVTEIVPLGVNHSEFYPVDEEEPFVLCLGRIDPQKNLGLIVRMMRKLDPSYTLTIAGSLEDRFEWHRDQIVDLAEDLNLSNRVEIVEDPTRREVVRLIQTCAVFLFPSTVDTFGLAVLEAMACGKPIVACKAGGIPELLHDCGVLLEPNAEQWEKALSELLSDPSLRMEIGGKAFEKSKGYSWDKTVDSYVEALGGLLARNEKR